MSVAIFLCFLLHIGSLTADLSEPPPPEGLQVKRTSPFSIEMTWLRSSGTNITRYKVYFSSITVATDMWNHVDVGLDTVVEIAGLEPYSSYAFRVRAVSDTTYDTRVDPKERGYLEGALSETVVAYALPRPKPGSPRSVHVNDIASTSVTLRWDPSVKVGLPNSYRIEFGSRPKTYRDEFNEEQQILDPGKVIENIPGALQYHVIVNLFPDTEYDFNISAIYADGPGPTFGTFAQTQPDAPLSLEAPAPVGPNTADSIQLFLRKATEKNGPLSHYLLVVVPVAEGYINESYTPDEYTLDDLKYESNLKILAPSLSITDNVEAHPYIAARWQAEELPKLFRLGDGKTYGGYSNKILLQEKKYRIFLRVYGIKQHLYTSSPFLDASIDLGFPDSEVNAGGITMIGKGHLLYSITLILIAVQSM